jgi:hypothetical protein
VKLRVRREGREARILERISTSSEFGAPNPLVTIGPGVRAPTHGDGGWAPHGLWAATKTSFGVGPDQARMLALLFVLVGAAVTVLRVRSRKRDTPDQTG